MLTKRHITIPKGFLAAGVKCGIKASGREDLAVLAAGCDVATAIVTTRNQVVGAPVLWCRQVLPRGYGRTRAIVINSGNSNVCTGKAGLKDAQAMARRLAGLLDCRAEKVLVASTGIIGHRLPMAKVRRGIDAAAADLGVGRDAAVMRAIMTTDTRAKSAVVRSRAGRRNFTVAGIAKGAGMMAPNLATMISLITTDLAITPFALHKALLASARSSFNAVTVDSDTSTSDTVVVMASGEAGNKPVTAAGPAFKRFCAALGEVCGSLARQIAADGEGATKLIEVTVTGARSGDEAEIAAKAVANSPLFKCAVNGADPNWGRIVMALGKSPAKVVPEKLSVKIGSQTIFAAGMGRKFDLAKVRRHLSGKSISVLCNLHLGRGAFTALTCDLSKQYVTINADYHT